MKYLKFTLVSGRIRFHFVVDSITLNSSVTRRKNR